MLSSAVASHSLKACKRRCRRWSRKAEPGLWLEEVPVPEVGDDDVLIRIKKTSICGTDVHIYNWDAWSQKTIPVPMVVGHEYVGVVERVGSG